MNKIIEKFELHDGIINLIKLVKDELFINFELLNLKSLETEEIYLKFKECTNVHLNNIDMVDWKNSSVEILEGEILKNRLTLFL